MIATTLLYLVVFGLLVAVAVIDMQTMTIPNPLNAAILLCGVLAIFINPELSLGSRFLGMLCVSVPLFILTLVSPDSFGGGDIKLMAAAGFLLGWQHCLVAACIGVLIGGLYGLYLLTIKKKSARERFAFGPFLCSGIAVAMLFGPQIISWYQPV